MKTATYKLTSRSAYSQSRLHGTPKLDKEQPDAYERRTWIEKAHFTRDGEFYIPAMAFKQALDETGKRLGKIPGKGMATYTKQFKGGVLISEPVMLGVTRADFEADLDELKEAPMRSETAFSWGGYCNADGKRASGTRVFRRFPEVKHWEGELTIYVFDEILTEKEITTALSEAGKFVGIGRFRAENGGYYGRFDVELLSYV